MNKNQALKLLRGGQEGISEWNRWRDSGEEVPSLNNADLSRADLRRVNLSRVDLNGASLQSVQLDDADLRGAKLCNASLASSHLSRAEFRSTDLRGANLKDADLWAANLIDCILAATKFETATWGWTVIANLDLSEASGLDSAVFAAPSSIGVDTLIRSEGQIPASFLRGCGFQPWQVIQAKTCAPGLTRDQFTDLQYQVNIARNQGPLFIGGVFISYSHDDSGFVDKIHGRLDGEGVPVWLDRHDMVAGDLQKQVSRAIRLNDVVLLVLSESSIKSDWVEHELEMARKKEQDEGRDVLCPVALDDSWKDKMSNVLWRQVKKKNVLDFSEWETEAFDASYRKLTDGLRVNYGSGTT